MLPTWQGWPGVQATPDVQATQAPLPQTWLVPQAVPSATEPPRSTHASRPVAQLVCPVWQGKLDGAQDLPAVHAPHTPPWQARPAPQAAPSATGFPLSAQSEA